MASWDIESLSYAEQLSLPGYTFADHWRATKQTGLPEFMRPTRRDVASYLARYPAAVGIEDSIHSSTQIPAISRLEHGQGFRIFPLDITSQHLVLATGIFNLLLQPAPFLSVLKTLSPKPYGPEPFGPVLIIGSGFTAADIIISTPPHRKIIHIFNWEPTKRPSPLKACHGSAYPEYAWVYKIMSSAVQRHQGREVTLIQQMLKNAPKSRMKHFAERDWSTTYEGFPNARIMETSLDIDYAQIWSELPDKVRRQSVDIASEHSSQAEATPPRKPSISSMFSSQGDNAPPRKGSMSSMFGRRKSSLPSTHLAVPDSAASSTRRSSLAVHASNPAHGPPPVPSATVLIGRSYIGVSSFDETNPRQISSFHYAAGRRGSLSYLRPQLLREVLASDGDGHTSNVSSPLLAPHPLPSLDGLPGATLSPGATPAHSLFTNASPFASKAQASIAPPHSHSSSEPPKAAATKVPSSKAPADLFSNATSTGDLASSLLAHAKPDSQPPALTHAQLYDPERDPPPPPTTSNPHDFALDPFAHPEELLITGQTLRGKIESFEENGDEVSFRRNQFEMAKNVFVIGSLTGDSLIRFAYGGCCAVGGVLLGGKES
jgi:hypothetical protein